MATLERCQREHDNKTPEEKAKEFIKEHYDYFRGIPFRNLNMLCAELAKLLNQQTLEAEK